MLTFQVVDLRRSGIEQFLTFKSDRSFRFVIDGRRFEWGAPIITGLKLKQLAGVDPVSYEVWQEVRGAEDRPITDNEQVDLNQPGVERFFTGKKTTTEGAQTSFLPASDRQYLQGGRNFIFLKLSKSDEPQYAWSNDFSLLNPRHNELYEVLAILKRLWAA